MKLNTNDSFEAHSITFFQKARRLLSTIHFYQMYQLKISFNSCLSWHSLLFFSFEIPFSFYCVNWTFWIHFNAYFSSDKLTVISFVISYRAYVRNVFIQEKLYICYIRNINYSLHICIFTSCFTMIVILLLFSSVVNSAICYIRTKPFKWLLHSKYRQILLIQ